MLSSPHFSNVSYPENDDDDDCTQPFVVTSLPSLDAHRLPPLHPLHHCIATLGGHSSYVAALAVHGNSIFSGGSDQEIRLWSLEYSSSSWRADRFTSFTVAETKSPVKSLVVSGENLFSSHQDGKIRVWQISQRDRHCYKLKAALPTPTDRFVRSLLPENYVQVRRHKKRTWVHHVDAVSGLALSRDGELLYSVSWDRALKVWRTAGGGFRCVESVGGAHQDAINAVAVSCDGHVYTGSADARINVWRKEEEGRHALVQTLERHAAAVNALALSADGRVLYSGACDRTVMVWEGGGGGGGRMAAASELRGHERAILCLAAAGGVVCSGSADATVRVWRRGGEKGRRYWCLAVLEGHGGPVKSLAMTMSDSGMSSGAGSSCSSSSSTSPCIIVYSGGLDCDIKVWRLLLPLPNSTEENIG
ncbi:vegetative incompatibility protein HET-E-1-like [Canna indica]|uniref:Vegetative incompatibility protein HET-E-1-like n=1 Tax=Canna indica TaxID=4628 RepID=A0AAQ3JTB0_9LILI|nr:vegetative incompatibility protein HET-E-1-like [Canna indica]